MRFDELRLRSMDLVDDVVVWWMVVRRKVKEWGRRPFVTGKSASECELILQRKAR